MRLPGEVRQLPFPHGNEGADDADVARLVGVVGLHGIETAFVEGAHEKGFGQIVQVLGQGEDVVPMPAAGGVERAAFHAGAEGAVAVFAHVFSSPFDDGFFQVQVFDAQFGDIGLQGRRVETVGVGRHGGRAYREADGRAALQVQQGMQQGQGVLAPGQAQQHPVAVADHVVVDDGPAGLAQQGFRRCVAGCCRLVWGGCLGGHGVGAVDFSINRLIRDG